MKTIGIFILFFIVGKVNLVLAQDGISKTNFKDDLDVYKNSISSKHKNPFTKISKQEFNQKIDSLISVTPNIDKDKFIVELFRINAFIEDEHTILFPEFELEMPFRFELFDEGMTIIASDSSNQKFLLHRIIKIDNTSWDKIDSLYKTMIKRDNPFYFKFFETYYFHHPELLKGLGITNNAASLNFQLLSPSGDTINTIINSRKKSQSKPLKYATPFKNLLAYSKNKNYWFIYDDKSKILYFNYRTCTEDKDEPFKAFNDKLFQKIEEVKPSQIILDLRFNGGGSSRVLKPFIESIKKSELNTNNRFFVLIGRKVMSSSLMNAVEFKRKTKATFVGEPTGGNINHFGELKSFVLPDSKIKVTYSTKFWKNWKGHNGSLKPDIETKYQLSNFLNAYDEAIEMIKQK